METVLVEDMSTVEPRISLKIHSRNVPVVSTAFSDRATTSHMRLVLHPSVRRGIVNSTIQRDKLF